MAPKRKAEILAARRRAKEKMTLGPKPTATSGLDEGNDGDDIDDTPMQVAKRVKTGDDSTAAAGGTGTKKSLKEQARARAKAWAEKDSQKGLAKKSTTPSSAGIVGKKSPPPKKTTKKTPAKFTSPARKTTMPPLPPSAGFSSGTKTQTGPAGGIIKRAPAAAAASPASTTRVVRGGRPTYHPAAGAAADNAEYSDEDENQDDSEEEEEEEQTVLEQTLSLQIVHNAENYGRGPTNDNPPTGLEGSGEDDDDEGSDGDRFEGDEIDDSDPIIVDGVGSGEQKRSCAFVVFGFFTLCVIVGAIFSIGIDLPFLSGGPRCYLDSGTGLGCTDISPNHVSTCPDGGSCHNGKLVDCHKLFYEINPSGTACKTTAAKKDFHKALVKVLQDASLEGRGCDETAWPFIGYSELLAASPDTLLRPSRELIEVLADDGFGIEWEDGTLKLQLPVDYQKKPKHCQLRDDAKGLVEWFGSKLYGVFFNIAVFALAAGGMLVGELFQFVMQSIPHFIGFIAVAGVALWVHKRGQTQTKRRAVVNGTSKVLDKLHKNSGVPMQIDLIRDQLADELYPKRQGKQRHWKKTIWVDVKKDVSKQNGVQCTHVSSSGKPVPAWKSIRQTTFVN